MLSNLIAFIVKVYMVVIVADAILSFFPQVHRQQWAHFIRKMASYSLRPIRKILPPELPFDFSPLVVFLILNLFLALW